jgi:hypothetical protein
MASNLIPIKAFLGRYYTELQYSATQEKYKNTKLDAFFDQSFHIQNNKVQMIVDPSMKGLMISVAGNEIYVSKELYDHPNVTITNTLESNNQTGNPRSLYNAEIFSTLAYLACQNHTIFQIIGPVDEPIYTKFKSDYETFYSSVLVFELSNAVDVEIVEEIQSLCALNSVVNYVLQSDSNLKLTTFYQNHISAVSFTYRNIIAQDNSQFTHILLGKGSAGIIDENKIHTHKQSKSEFLGIVNSNKRDFHSILYIQPASDDYSVSIDYRTILHGEPSVSFYPIILGQEPAEKAVMSISNITMEQLPVDTAEKEIEDYLRGIIDRTILDRMIGTKRFYDNKAKFLHLP